MKRRLPPWGRKRVAVQARQPRRWFMRRFTATGSVIATATAVACALAWALAVSRADEDLPPAAPEARRPATGPASTVAVPVADKHLHNLHLISPRVLSGGQPYDEAAFRSLRDRGVKIVISVD